METVGVFLQSVIGILISMAGPLLVALFGAITLYVAPQVKKWLDGAAEAIKTRATAEQYALLVAFVQQAIRAAHQSGLIGAIENDGAAKKRFAIDFVENLLRQYNIDYDVDILADAIEAEIKRVLTEVAQEQQATVEAQSATGLAQTETTVEVTVEEVNIHPENTVKDILG